MATATKKQKTRVTKPVAIKEPILEAPVVQEPVVEIPTVEAPIEKCFYCRESKYEPSTTRCPVSSHTQNSLRGGL